MKFSILISIALLAAFSSASIAGKPGNLIIRDDVTANNHEEGHTSAAASTMMTDEHGAHHRSSRISAISSSIKSLSSKLDARTTLPGWSDFEDARSSWEATATDASSIDYDRFVATQTWITGSVRTSVVSEDNLMASLSMEELTLKWEVTAGPVSTATPTPSERPTVTLSSSVPHHESIESTVSIKTTAAGSPKTTGGESPETTAGETRAAATSGSKTGGAGSVGIDSAMMAVVVGVAVAVVALA